MGFAVLVDGSHAAGILLDALDAYRRYKLDVRGRANGVEKRAMDVGTMAHRVGISEALAKGVAHGHRTHFGFVDRIAHEQALDVNGLATRALAHSQRVERRERIGTQLNSRTDFAD